jgi:hypothetical protein
MAPQRKSLLLLQCKRKKALQARLVIALALRQHGLRHQQVRVGMRWFAPVAVFNALQRRARSGRPVEALEHAYGSQRASARLARVGR